MEGIRQGVLCNFGENLLFAGMEGISFGMEGISFGTPGGEMFSFGRIAMALEKSWKF